MKHSYHINALIRSVVRGCIPNIAPGAEPPIGQGRSASPATARAAPPHPTPPHPFGAAYHHFLSTISP